MRRTSRALAAMVAMSLITLSGCQEVPTTATGRQSGPPPGPGEPTPVRYALLVEGIDTTDVESTTVLVILLRVRTQEGRAVRAAEVDLGATEGEVYPEHALMNSDGTVTARWSLPTGGGRLVANLYGCARPLGQDCVTGPLLKWNQ